MASDRDFQQARERLAKLEEEYTLFKERFGIADTAGAASDEDARILEQVRKPDLKAAIKIHQEIHGSTLVEAQQYVRELMQRMNK